MPSPRVRTVARWSLVLLLVVATLFAVLLAGSQLLNQSGPRAWIARRVGSELRGVLQMPVEVGDVRVSLLPPRLALTGLRLGSPGEPLATIAVAEVAVGKVRLADREIVINQLRLAGVHIRGKAPKLPKRRGGGSWIAIRIRQLQLEDVAIADLRLPGDVKVRADDIEARWTGSPRSPLEAVVVHADGFTVEAPGVEPMGGSLVAWGRRTEEGFELRRVRGSGLGWRISAVGTLLRGGELTLTGEADVDLLRLDEGLHIRAALGGRASAGFRLTVAGSTPRVEAEVTCERAEVAGFVFTGVEGNALVSAEGIEASLRTATFQGGSLSGTYTLGGLGEPWRHRVVVRGAGVVLGGFLSQIGVPSAGLAGSCGVSAELAWSGANVREGNGTALVAIAPGAGDVPVSGRATLELEGDGAMRIRTEGIRLAGAAVRWDGRLSLGTWIPTWTVSGNGIRIPIIARLLEGWIGTPVLPGPLDGLATFDLRMRGAFKNLTVVGDVAAAPLRYGPVEVDSLVGSFSVGGGAIRFEDGVVTLGNGRARTEGQLTFGDEVGLRVRVSADSLPLERIVGWTGLDLPIEGRAGATGAIGGTLAAPEVAVRTTLSDVVVAGVQFGEGVGLARVTAGVIAVDELHVGPLAGAVEIDLRERRASIDATLDRFGLQGVSPVLADLVGDELTLELRGSFPLAAPSGRLLVSSVTGARGTVELTGEGINVDLVRPDVWRIAGRIENAPDGHRGRFSVQVDSLAALAADLAGRPVAVNGTGAADVFVTLEPGREPLIEGELTELSTAVYGDAFAIEQPARLVVRGREVTVDGVRLLGAGGRLEGRFRRSRDGTVEAVAKGVLPVSAVGLVWPEARLGGLAEVTVTVAGTDLNPIITGSAEIRGGSILLPGFPAALTHVNGTLDFVPEAIRLRGMEFSLGGGSGRGDGRIILDPSVELDLQATFAGVKWNVSAGLSPNLSGSVRIVGPLEDLRVSGNTVLQRTVFREEINLQRLVLQQILAPERAVVATGQGIGLDLWVGVPATLEVNTPLVRVTFRGDLRVVGSSVQPGLLGRLEMLPGGELELSGQVYELDRGTITFSDDDRINPYLDVVAHAWVQSVEITVGLVGTLDRLTPTLVSNPALPETDILALLSTGRRADQATQAQAGALAGSFLTEQLAGVVARRARTLLDVDQLRVDPFAATETGSPTARVTVVKQLSSDWSVTVSTNLAANREEVIQSRWRLGQGVYLQASRDIDGSYTMEVKWQRRY